MCIAIGGFEGSIAPSNSPFAPFHKGTTICFTESSVNFYALQHKITLQLYGLDPFPPCLDLPVCMANYNLICCACSLTALPATSCDKHLYERITADVTDNEIDDDGYIYDHARI